MGYIQYGSTVVKIQSLRLKLINKTHVVTSADVFIVISREDNNGYVLCKAMNGGRAIYMHVNDLISI